MSLNSEVVDLLSQLGVSPKSGPLPTRTPITGEALPAIAEHSAADATAAIAAAHALILPSLAEGLPMVVIEAMACGRPVISTAINGVPELLTAAEGWLVPAGDPAALADAIDLLAQTPNAVLAQMGQSARARALSRHDGDIEAAKLAALFAEYSR